MSQVSPTYPQAVPGESIKNPIYWKQDSYFILLPWHYLEMAISENFFIMAISCDAGRFLCLTLDRTDNHFFVTWEEWLFSLCGQASDYISMQLMKMSGYYLITKRNLFILYKFLKVSDMNIYLRKIFCFQVDGRF